MMLIDSHCHLNHPKLHGDVGGAVARARAAGVGAMLTIGTCMREFDDVLAIAKGFDDIYCSVGVHPHDAEGEPDVSAAELLARAADPLVIGIGETGLDYYYDTSPRDLQKASFARHIDAARASQLPLIVHTRDAEADTATLLREGMAKGPFPGVIHCFTASKAFAEIALELGFYISISGIITFKGADDLREAVCHVPLDRLLIETDAPFLAPVPMRGKANEPAFIGHTAAALAALKGISTAALVDATTDNFFRLFTRARRPEFPSREAST
jgi:TatD DNase family protein